MTKGVESMHGAAKTISAGPVLQVGRAARESHPIREAAQGRHAFVQFTKRVRTC
jgi:hypothetical protein